MTTKKSTEHPNTSVVAHKPASRASRTVQHGAVLHLCPHMESEDPAREVVDFCVLANRSGWPAFIASAGGVLVPEAERSTIKHRVVPFMRRRGLFNDWRNKHKLDVIAQRDRPTLVHAHGIDMLRYAYGMCRTHHLPLVADILHPVDSPAHRKLIAAVLHMSSVFRVPSEFMGHHLMNTWNIPAERIYHIKSGVNLQWFSAGYVTPERLSALSRQWRLPEQGSIILVPMPLVAGMGHDVLLEALASLRNDHVFAVLIGRDVQGGMMRQEIEKTITTLGLSGKVVMPEFCQDWPAALWHASAVVLPNTMARGENRVLLAAQAMGRPVIVTDVGANSEIVDHDAAWIIPPNNIDELSKALRGAVGLDVNHRLGLAERARDFIADSFPLITWFEESIAMYQDVLDTAQKARRKAA